MKTVVFLILAALTIIYLVWAAVMDLKERMIYVFPVLILHVAWSSYLLFSGIYSAEFISIFWLINLIVYLILNKFGIWGGGDSDLFLLFGNIVLASGAMTNGYAVAITECLYLCAGLGMSIGIGRIEAGMKREDMKLKREVAVVPGIALIMTALLIKGFIWRVI